MAGCWYDCRVCQQPSSLKHSFLGHKSAHEGHAGEGILNLLLGGALGLLELGDSLGAVEGDELTVSYSRTGQDGIRFSVKGRETGGGRRERRVWLWRARARASLSPCSTRTGRQQRTLRCREEGFIDRTACLAAKGHSTAPGRAPSGQDTGRRFGRHAPKNERRCFVVREKDGAVEGGGRLTQCRSTGHPGWRGSPFHAGEALRGPRARSGRCPGRRGTCGSARGTRRLSGRRNRHA